MKLKIQSIHFDATQKLLDYIEEKVGKLDTFYPRIIDGDVVLRLEKNDRSKNKIIEIKLNVPGNTLFVKEQSTSFETAAINAIEGLKKQLLNRKEKYSNYFQPEQLEQLEIEKSEAEL